MMGPAPASAAGQSRSAAIRAHRAFRARVRHMSSVPCHSRRIRDDSPMRTGLASSRKQTGQRFRWSASIQRAANRLPMNAKWMKIGESDLPKLPRSRYPKITIGKSKRVFGARSRPLRGPILRAAAVLFWIWPWQAAAKHILVPVLSGRSSPNSDCTARKSWHSPAPTSQRPMECDVTGKVCRGKTGVRRSGGAGAAGAKSRSRLLSHLAATGEPQQKQSRSQEEHIRWFRS